MDRLLIHWNKKQVGLLSRHTKGRVQFQYSQEWLKKTGCPISLSLPCREEKYAPGISTAFFENLLPESNARSILAFNKRFDKKDTFAFLEHFGQDCAGALSITPEQEEPDFRPGKYEQIDTALGDALDRIQTDPENRQLYPEIKNARLSIAGAQDKLPVYMEKGHFYLPMNPGSPTTHIIKPASPYFQHIQRNEAFCMDLAKSLGLNVPVSRLIKTGSHELFAVERYDRKKQNKTILRIHQEDFCQAMGVPASRKYQEKGGPGFTQCRELVDEYLSDQGFEIRMNIAAITAFNYIIGNHDAHGKNFSIIHDQTITMAPFYDLVSTQVYPSLETNFAMAVGKTYRHDRLTEKAWTMFAKQMGMRPAKLAKILDTMLQSISNKFEFSLSAHEKAYGSSPMYTHLFNIIQKNLGQLKILTDLL